jgi:hypothetical protein
MPTEPVDARGATASSGPGQPAPEVVGDAASQTIDAPQGTVEELTQELARAEAERDAAVRALDKEGRRGRLRVKVRRGFVGVLVVLFSVLLPITFTVTWVHNVVLNTNGWVRTVGPLTSDPVVANAVATTVTDELFTSLHAQKQIASVLPPRASFLAGPIASGVQGYLQTGVAKVIASPQFKTVWIQANRFAHQELLKALEGHSSAVTTTNGQVVLDLVPLLNSALANVEPFIAGVVGHSVKLPTISGNELPSAVCEQINKAVGTSLPSSCGQIPLFPASKLKEAQRLVRLFNGIVVLLLVLTPVLAAVAIWLSRRRRRTILQLGVGGLLGLVVFRRVIVYLQHTLANVGQPQNKAAREAVLSHVFSSYFTVSAWMLAILAVIVVVVAVTGPYAWAGATRAQLTRFGGKAADLIRATAAGARDDRTIDWVRAHLDLLRIAGVVLAIILVLALPISYIGILIIVALLVVYELWLQRFKTSLPDGPPDAPPPDSSQSVTPSASS